MRCDGEITTNQALDRVVSALDRDDIEVRSIERLVPDGDGVAIDLSMTVSGGRR